MFGGGLVFHVQCTVCGAVSSTSEAFVDLGLSLPGAGGGGTRVPDALAHVLAVEEMPLATGYVCTRCGCAVAAWRRADIAMAPAHLVLSVNRFRYDAAVRRQVKVRAAARACPPPPLPPALARPSD